MTALLVAPALGAASARFLDSRRIWATHTVERAPPASLPSPPGAACSCLLQRVVAPAGGAFGWPARGRTVH
ncbi:MAG: hypothetical protein J3K34DRAFT_445321 [Monoraphidium minutum]|nr:MAG: hypothetical protein J3K34DRAFT_445321 [Monoraphidium minutum]